MYLVNHSIAPSRISLPAGSSRPARNCKWRLLPVLTCLLVLSQFGILVPVSKAQNIINTVAGGAVPSGLATAADIPGPTAVAEDGSGNIYIAAPNSYYVYEVSPSGGISIFAGIGVQDESGDNGPATSAALGGPAALAFDGSGDLLIADLNRVRCVLAVANGCMGSSAAVGSIVTIAGSSVCAQSIAACGDGGPATQAMLDGPQGMVVDKAGNLYIADTGDQRVRCVLAVTGGCLGQPASVAVGTIVTVAGTGRTCNSPTNPCGDKGAPLSANLNVPTDVLLDSSGDLYISDTRDQRVRCIIAVTGGCAGSTSAVGDIVTVVGSGQFCTSPSLPCGDGGKAATAHLHNPSGLSFDSLGNLYIADQLDYRIREVTASNHQISTIAGSGNAGFSGDGSSATLANLNLPYSVLVDSGGNLWITDTGNQRIREVSGGNINTFAGGGLGDGVGPMQASLANPTAVTWDAFGNFYIADTANNRIRKVSAGADSTITTVAGNGNAGYTGDGGLATSATLNAPNGVALDASGNIYIADSNNYVVRALNTQATAVTIFGVTIQPGNIATVVGNGAECLPNTAPCGDGGLATSAQLTFPSSITFDGNGNLYIADYYGNRVRVVNPTSGNINTEAGTGAPGYAGDGGPATSAKLDRPFGVAVDPSGNVYISDSKNNRVRCVITVSGGCGGSADAVGSIVTYAFNGKAGFAGNGRLAVNAEMTDMLGAATDPAGNLFVGGGADSVVQRIDAATLTVDTVAGTPSDPGQIGFAGDGGPATSATLNNIGLSVNGAESLLIADTGNNRIRQVSLVANVKKSTGQLTFPATTVGQTSAPLSVTYTNKGAADQALGTPQITGADHYDFAVSSTTCGAVLAPDTSCSVSVTFTPEATGTRSAYLKISGTTAVSLSGTGD